MTQPTGLADAPGPLSGSEFRVAAAGRAVSWPLGLKALLILLPPGAYLLPALLTVRRYPGLALRRLGKNTVFDRAWSLASIRLLNVMTLLYTFDRWAG